MPRGYIRSRGYIQSNIPGGGGGGGRSNILGGGGAGMRRSGAVGRSPKAIAKCYASTRARTSIIGVYQPPFIAVAIRYQKNQMKPTPIIWFHHNRLIWFHHNRRARGSRHARPSRLTRWMRRVPSCTLAKADCGVARYSGRRSPIGLCQNCVRMRSICVPQTDTTSCVPPVSGSHESRPAGTLGGLVPFPHFW